MTWNRVDVDESGNSRKDLMSNLIQQHIAPMIDLWKEQEEQRELRERYPALQAAWENYQLTLRLVKGETTEESNV